MKVVAYTTNWCSDCIRSKTLLKELGIPFEEIDIEAVEGAAEEMELSNGGIYRIPTIIIDDTHVLVEPSDEALTEVIDRHLG